jgi:hypothetical protein
MSASAAISVALSAPDAFTANRLMQAYDISTNKDAFVLALIQEVLTANLRLAVAQRRSASRAQ